jgi:hypothetical protein
VREAVLERVNGLPHADPEEWERRGDAPAQLERHVEVDAAARVGHAVRVEAVERLGQLITRMNCLHESRARWLPAGLVVADVAEAVLLLVLGVAVDGSELAHVGGAAPVEIVVAYAPR